ncbi:MAG: DUF6438 domain-containing protein [Gammaproteobacteria bacterium]
MRRNFHKRGRRGRKGANFFFTALLVAIVIFVIVMVVKKYVTPAGAPETAHNRAPATVTSAMPNPARSLAGFSLVLIRCRHSEGCPYYDLHIQADKLAYSGVRGVAKQGNLQVPLSKARKRKLLDLVQKARFFSLGDSYELSNPHCRATRTDAPTLTVGVTLNGVTKIVRANQACVNVPARLIALADGIDRVTRSVQWTGVPASAGTSGS